MRRNWWATLLCLLLWAAATGPHSVCRAQYNPLLPSGIGSGSEYGGMVGEPEAPGIGRGKGPIPKGRDANPAETLLRRMDGTNYGHYTGHAYFRGQAARDATRSGRRPAAPNVPSVRYRRRGDYERALYSRSPNANRTRAVRPPAPSGLPNPARYY